jgi:HSP20 family molecular chaperone IbpA
MLNVEHAIAEVASVYQSLTGKPIEPGRYEPPPEVDPLGQAESNYRRFKGMLERQAPTAQPPNAPAPAAATAFAPAADVVELEREVRVHIDLPGVPRDHVSVAVAGDVLVIRGERPMGRPQTSVVRHGERRGGPFQRVIALPPRGRREGIEATLREGVLTISIPTDGGAAEAAEMPVDVK